MINIKDPQLIMMTGFVWQLWDMLIIHPFVFFFFTFWFLINVSFSLNIFSEILVSQILYSKKGFSVFIKGSEKSFSKTDC